MKNLKELEQKYLELGKEIEALKKQSEEEELTYPIYCRLEDSSIVVKFTGLTTGELVIGNEYKKGGKRCNEWIKHTDAKYWKRLDVCEETGFFDGQLVWCWDNEDTHFRVLKFYDAKNKCTYQFDGTKNGSNYDNYALFEGNYPDWALEAFKTLER